jgi:hypothetical protein
MMDPVRELKIRAEILHTRLASGEADGLERLRVLRELKRADAAALAAPAHRLRYKHCLAVVARECGFSSWEHALRVLEADPTTADVGTLLYDRGEGASGVLHHWFAVHDEARAFLDGSPAGVPRQYLLAYGRDFFVANRDFVEALGLDPDDPDWAAIGWDWARPADPAARGRLYYKRLVALRRTP